MEHYCLYSGCKNQKNEADNACSPEHAKLYHAELLADALICAGCEDAPCQCAWCDCAWCEQQQPWEGE